MTSTDKLLKSVEIKVYTDKFPKTLNEMRHVAYGKTRQPHFTTLLSRVRHLYTNYISLLHYIEDVTNYQDQQRVRDSLHQRTNRAISKELTAKYGKEWISDGIQ